MAFNVFSHKQTLESTPTEIDSQDQNGHEVRVKPEARPGVLEATLSLSDVHSEPVMNMEIPGTEELVDLNHDIQREHAGKDIVLIPEPSDDPNDPLNWDKRRKAFFMVFPIMATFMVASVTSVVGICIPGFESVGIDPTSVNAGSGYCFLLLGWMNLVVQPLAMSYGRRSVMIMSLIVSGVVCPVWISQVKSDGNYYGSRIVQGAFGSVYETLIEILVADVFFVHDRAFWMSWYGFALSGGSFLGPIASSFVFENMGWRWVFYFHAIFTAVVVVLMTCFMEESGFKRPHKVIEAQNQGSLPSSDISDNDSKQPTMKLAYEGTSVPVSEKVGENDIDEDRSDVGGELDHGHIESQEKYKPHSYLHRMRLFSKLHPFPTFKQFIRPILILYYFPQILWAGFMVASSVSAFQILTGSISMVLSAPPYNFTIEDTGLAYIGPTIATILGCIYSGPFADWFCVWIARRRGGIHEAEDRIYLGLICIVLIPFGSFLYGVGAYHHINWFGVVFGLSVFGGVIIVASVIPYTYAIDACRDLGSDCIVAIVLVRNTVSFAFTYSIVPWINSQGLQNTFLTVGFLLGVLFWITGFPMIRYGKYIRKRTAPRYYRWAADTIE